MSINKTYAVFGLGRYGMAVAKELVDSGAEVLAVDLDQSLVNSAAAELPVCKCADVTDADVIRRLGIGNFDTVIISMANNLDASVMAIALCKEAGVRNVIAKCGSEMHRRIFLRVGADKVVFPESESGRRLAKNLLSSGFAEMIELSDAVSMVDLDVREEWVGKSLIELNLRRRFAINIVAIRRGERVDVDIDPDLPLTADMKLIVIAGTKRLSRLKKK